MGGVACHHIDGLYCAGVTFDQLGACAELLPVGARCTTSDACGSGAICEYNQTDFTYSCTQRIETGPCTTSLVCVDGSYCSTTDGMCHPKLAAGEPCLSFDDCQSDDCTPEGFCAGEITESDCSGSLF
jgi:hypothetical protein